MFIDEGAIFQLFVVVLAGSMSLDDSAVLRLILSTLLACYGLVSGKHRKLHSIINEVQE